MSLTDAIVTNHPLVYLDLTLILLNYSEKLREKMQQIQEEEQEYLIAETMVILRRQVSAGKIVFLIEGERVLLEKRRLELLHHLDGIVDLVGMTGKYARFLPRALALEEALKDGRGFGKLMVLRDPVQGALYNLGCKRDDDRSEIFDEACIVFFQKLIKGEIGLFLTTEKEPADQCHVYNKSYYQSSKLSTYLTGIAKNIFLNRVKLVSRTVPETAEPAAFKETAVLEVDPTELQTELFEYYRVFLEPRRIRTAISLLQYDCSLEDKEVKELLGINNARIHSSRLRDNFDEWLAKNKHKLHVLIDQAAAYQQERTTWTGYMNDKIRYINHYLRNSRTPAIDLSLFREEFHTEEAFRKHAALFNDIYYVACKGKASRLAGIPGEAELRDMLRRFKTELFNLLQLQALVYLVFYASSEPVSVILDLLKTLLNELSELEKQQQQAGILRKQIQESGPASHDTLSELVYTTNQTLFEKLSRIGKSPQILN